MTAEGAKGAEAIGQGVRYFWVMKLADLRAAFERVDLKPILAATLERDDVSYPLSWSRYVVGAAALAGRIDEALTLFQRDGERGEIDPEDLGATRFYLAVGLARVSRYEEALKHVTQNLADVRAGRLMGEGRFFAYQGVAFFRFFQCRYPVAFAAAQRAFSAALSIGYAYGMAIARDLMGHTQFRRGEIAQAIATWEDAMARAKRLEFAGLAASISASVANSRAATGLDGVEGVARQEALVKSFSAQDNFSRASAEIELARQLTLRGELDRSDAFLERAGSVVLKAGHRRQKAMLLHRLANNRYLSGRLEDGAAFLRDAERALDPAYDLEYTLMILGLRRKLERARGEPRFAAADPQIARLTARIGSGVARNILWRETGAGTPTLAGDDPTGDLRHRAARGYRSNAGDFAAMTSSGLLGLIVEMLPLPLGAQAVCVDVLPGKILVLDRGNVAVSEEPVSEAMKKLAVTLSHGSRSKRELVELLWGYDYHSLRHDPLVYALVNRLRKALGARAACRDWLVASAGGYVWQDGVRIYVHPQAPREHLLPDVDAPALEDSELNWRQVAILTELVRERALGPADGVALFGISRITASRDFAGLHDRGLVRRLGKGRSTRYALRRGKAP